MSDKRPNGIAGLALSLLVLVVLLGSVVATVVDLSSLSTEDISAAEQEDMIGFVYVLTGDGKATKVHSEVQGLITVVHGSTQLLPPSRFLDSKGVSCRRMTVMPTSDKRPILGWTTPGDIDFEMELADEQVLLCGGKVLELEALPQSN